MLGLNVGVAAAVRSMSGVDFMAVTGAYLSTAAALALLLSVTSAFGQTLQVYLYTPSSQPSSKDCEFVAKANAKEVSRLTQQHQQCLQVAAPSSGEYKVAAPCSRMACRQLHFQMEFASASATDINRDCRARVPRDERGNISSSTGASPTGNGFGSAALEADRAAGWIQDMRDLASERDRPWEFLARKLGQKIADEIRGRTVDAVGPEGLRDSLEWQAFEALAARAEEVSSARTPENHLRNVINQAALARLQVEYARGLGSLERVFADVGRSYDALATTHASNFVSTQIRPFGPGGPANRPERSPMQSSSADCAVLRDERRSRALMEADLNGWLALTQRCTGK